MAKPEGGAKAALKKLKKKHKKLKAALKALKPAKAAHPVSPLAPPEGFPAFPVIAGVRFSAAPAGVKYAGRTDVMLAAIDKGASVAGVFTRSATRSAPVRDCEAKLAALKTGGAKGGFAIVVNSGNSNAFTGAAGEESVAAVTGAVATALKLPGAHVFSASTGVIGQPLLHARIVDAVPALVAGLSPDGGEAAARAIMTTDTFPKGAVETVQIGGEAVQIAGFAKGSGMIAPDMATMLAYIFTDARVPGDVLQSVVSRLNRGSFNAITVDSDTSTSDSLMVVATGKAGPEIGSATSADGKALAAALGRVMLRLAHLVVRDGEGATKFVEVAVTGAATAGDARKVARAIADSPLVKTAIAGEDPNWGRIVMAVGKSGARADRDLLSIKFGDVVVAEGGAVAPSYREEDGLACFRQQEIRIGVDLGMGKGSAVMWTCDLTHQYITINADYRS